MNSPIDIDELKELLQRCKAWTKEVEWMISTSTDHGVTPAQLDALHLLHIQEENPLPELDTTNWVGLINEYCQRHLSNAAVAYTFNAKRTADGTLKWRCSLTVPGYPVPFPRVEDWSPEPMWPSKREAKQFAAKCGYTWIKNQKRTIIR